MSTRLNKYSVLIIAAMLLVTIAFAGVASATDIDTAQKLADELNIITPGAASLNGNTVVLLKDVQLNDEFVIQSSTPITLDLNGSSLTANLNTRLFNIKSGYTFTLEDTSSAKTGKLIGNGTQPLKAGAVYDEGTFIMYGGNITGCSAKGKCGGVFVENAVFIMYGGEITNCSCTNGYPASGGVHVGGSGGSSIFTMMNGANITNCLGTAGGGVIVNVGTFNMYGGNITNCMALDNGGGLYSYTGTININGTAKITDNTLLTGPTPGTTNNVYLGGNNQLNLLAGGFTGKISINYTSTSPAKDSTFGTADATATGAENFVADNDATLFGSIDGTTLKWTKYLPPYVEVSDWDQLVANVSEWTNTTTMRTVVLTNTTAGAYKNTTGTAGTYTGIPISGNITIMPSSSATDEIKIDANGMGRIFTVKTGGNLTLCKNSTGSAILNVTGGYHTDGAGGAIHIDEGTFNMYNCTITNSTNTDGGGVHFYDGTFNMYDGIITKCSADYGGGVCLTAGAFNMYGGIITECTADNGGGVCQDGLSSVNLFSGEITGNTALIGAEIFISVSSTLSGNAKIGGNDLAILNNLNYPNITSSCFTGSVANITLYDIFNYQPRENPSAWLGQVVIKNGASVKDKFALSSAYSDYQLIASGDDLVLGKNMPTGSLFVNISNTNNNNFTLILYAMDDSIINTTTLSAGITNFTFRNLDNGVYTLFGYYMNGYVPTGVIKMVRLSDGTGYADLGFPQLNITSGTNTSAEPGASTPHVSIDGLDTIVRAEPAPTDKVIIFRFDATGEAYNTSNTNQSKLRTEILANTPNAEITYLNFTINKLTYNFTTGDLESVDIIDNPTNLMTIYMEYDMTNRQNIQVWRIHDGPAEQLQELATGEIPSEGTYKLDGTKGVFIYSKHFSPYTISSTTTSTPVTPSSGGSSSSHHSGSSQLAKSQAVDITTEPTTMPTQAQSTVIPTPSATSSTTQPTQPSPAPVFGLIAGLGAVALILTRLRQ